MSNFLTIKKTHELLNKGAIILDVRTDKEFCNSHVCRAIHIPIPLPPLSESQILEYAQELIDTLEPYTLRQSIILYCKKGIRAKIGVKILKRLGYKNVYNLGGVETQPLKKYFKNPKKYCNNKSCIKICKCR